MVISEALTYEKIYFTLWETAQRYGSFAQFRVIGKSHDDRMIPMLEIGKGQDCVFCLSGLNGTDRQIPTLLVQMAQEYCKAYECRWMLEEFYDVYKLFQEMRFCMIPVLNPDGYEICDKGYGIIRNPIYRQMLKMQEQPYEEFSYNARGMDVSRNFPTSRCTRKRIHEEPASENETKALIRIFQEYPSRGLLYFVQAKKRIVYYRQSQGFAYNQRSYRLARHLQKNSSYRLEKGQALSNGKKQGNERSSGTAEQLYAEMIRQPSLTIEVPAEGPKKQNKIYREIYMLPLEYMYSLDM